MNFADALDKAAAEIERPPILPVGTYEWMIKKYETDRSGDGKWDICVFQLQCVSAQDDVDPDALASFGRYQGFPMRHSFMFNLEDEGEFNRTLYNLKRFLQDTLKCMGEEDNLKVGLANSVNKKFLGAIRWKARKDDPELQDAQIGKTAPLV